MMTKFRALLASTLIFPAAMAMADYPSGPVQFVVPFPPGDLEDVLTRMIAEDFQAAYGQPAAVMNRPGGGGGPFPGAVEVAMAPADGTTIGSFVLDVPLVGPLVGIPPLTPNPFEPVGIFLTYPFVLATSSDAPYQTMDELAAYAQSNSLTLGHFGMETSPAAISMALASSMGFEWGRDAGFDALDCNTLASGDVDVVNTTIQLIRPCLDDVTVLVSITPERLSLMPDVPTVTEIDSDLSLTLWNGLFVHKDTPQDVREAIDAVASETIASDRAQQFARDTGAQIYWMDAQESEAQLERDAESFATINSLIDDE